MSLLLGHTFVGAWCGVRFWQRLVSAATNDALTFDSCAPYWVGSVLCAALQAATVEVHMQF
jgi:hypothetical protein